MSGLRRDLLQASLLACLLAGCSDKVKDAPPLASEVNPGDPAAAELYASAKSADNSGDIKKAIKLYDKVAVKYSYSAVAPEARFRQAVLLDHAGDLLPAFDAYQQVIQRYQSSSLYSEARIKQAVVAHAAADGVIKNNFLGLKSRLDSKKIVEMLETVRDNAPRAASAPKAQFTIGQVLENRKKDIPAIDAYQKVVDDYPSSSYAPEAQFRIGEILLQSAARGNQNQANLDKARLTYEDLIQSYPGTKQAAASRKRISEIGSRDIQRSFDIAEFYDKKGQTASAIFYYKEVLRKTSGGDLRNRAQRRLQELNADEN